MTVSPFAAPAVGWRCVMRRSFARIVAVLAAVVAALCLASAAWAGVYVNGTLPAGVWRYSGWNYWYFNSDSKNCYCYSAVYLERSDRIWGVGDSGGYTYIDKTMYGGFGGYLRGDLYSGGLSYYHYSVVGTG
jgi:hypothetical protein